MMLHTALFLLLVVVTQAIPSSALNGELVPTIKSEQGAAGGIDENHVAKDAADTFLDQTNKQPPTQVMVTAADAENAFLTSDKGSVSDMCITDFDLHDTNRDGYVDQIEAKESDSEWAQVCAAADADKDGKISKLEFEQYISFKLGTKDDTLHMENPKSHQHSSYGHIATGVGTEMLSILPPKYKHAYYDSNGDGAIDLGEALAHGPAEAWSRTLEKYDSNKDALLSVKEFEVLAADWMAKDKEAATLEMLAATPPTDHEAVAPRSMSASLLDASAYKEKMQAAIQSAAPRFGETTRDRATKLSEMFASADQDSDGKLSVSEYRDAGDSSRYDKLSGVLKQTIDTNNDGTISSREENLAAEFEHGNLDLNNDGKLGTEEVVDAFEKKGWLAEQPWHIALYFVPTSGSQQLPSMVTTLLENGLTDRQLAMKSSCTAALDEDSPDDKMTGLIATTDLLNEPPLNASAATGMTTEERKWAAWAAHHGVTEEDIEIEKRSEHAVALLAPRRKPSMSKQEKDEWNTDLLEETLAVTSDLLSKDYCWRDTYDRGPGKPANCRSNYESRGAMCYERCDQKHGGNWHREDSDIEFCSEKCHGGSTDIGLYCRTNGHTRSKRCCGDCWPGWCCQTWCCGGCGSGWTDTGCFCEPSWKDQQRRHSPGKTKYDRSATGCTDNHFKDGPKGTPVGDFCYPNPKFGFNCQLTACQQKCPSHLEKCGPLACALDSTACASNIADMVGSVLTAIASTIALVASFGTSAAATTTAKIGFTVAQRQAMKKAAKAALRSMKKALTKYAVKAAIKRKLRQKLGKKAREKYRKEFKDWAQEELDAYIQEQMQSPTSASWNAIGAASDGSMDSFDFTEFDPTGISSAISTSADPDASNVDKAKAWMDMVANVDPTGWVAVASAFTHDKCDLPAKPQECPKTVDRNNWSTMWGNQPDRAGDKFSISVSGNQITATRIYSAQEENLFTDQIFKNIQAGGNSGWGCNLRFKCGHIMVTIGPSGSSSKTVTQDLTG